MAFAILALLALFVFDVGLIWGLSKTLLPEGYFHSIGSCVKGAIAIFLVSSFTYGVLSNPPFKLPVLVAGQSMGAFVFFTINGIYYARNQNTSWLSAIPWVVIVAYTVIKILVWCILEPGILKF